jgi:hypothetical protein
MRCPMGSHFSTTSNWTFRCRRTKAYIRTLSDGMTWAFRTSGTPSPLFGTAAYLAGLAFGNGAFAAIGITTLTSQDGVTWISCAINRPSYGLDKTRPQILLVYFASPISTRNVRACALSSSRNFRIWAPGM